MIKVCDQKSEIHEFAQIFAIWLWIWQNDTVVITSV